MFARIKIDDRITAVLFLLVGVAAVRPISSNDYFWHLAAGRWIIDHRSIPTFDPLALASAHIPWINGEWLYEVVLAALSSLVGHAGICVASAILIAAVFALAWRLSIQTHDRGFALLVATVAFAGAAPLLDVRPSVLGALLLVIALGLLGSSVAPGRLAIFYAVLTVLWINVHPSALLAPLLALVTILLDVRRWIVAVAGAVALLVNPYGWEALRAPFVLVSAIQGGTFMNWEWLPSPFQLYPLLYLTLAVAVLLYLCCQEKRTNLWRFVILIGLAALAIRHRRDQGLYFAALPVLIAPLPAMVARFSNWFASVAIVPLAWTFFTTSHRAGVDDTHFPVRAIATLQSNDLAGNIYSADQFGGFIEWTFYPERRALTDGRNELFLDYIAENVKAHVDYEVWRSLLEKYNVVIAVEDYHAADYKMPVDDPATGTRTMVPYSLVMYPRRHWALIAFDDAAMIFAKREAFPPEELAGLEYRYLVPDHASIHFARPEIREAARAEVARARSRLGDIEIVRKLERGLEQ